jgi:hypothetical protein
MRALPSLLRKQLETSVLAARRAAESASGAAIEGLGVFADRRPPHLDANQAALRNGLRAKWRQLSHDRELLVAECAYEQWHRLLFARFLAENGLLLHPQYKAPVTLADCDELAAELGEPDAWSVAARFAAEILPGIFRLDDPCVRLRLAPEGRFALEQILEALPPEMFAADDALGWVYQFWQKDKKDEINASERKIGGADLGPVTQLFTENYMVRFLLENSLGAWWAARHPDSPLVKGFDYLRFDDDGRPAAGPFDGWPHHVAQVTVMDPCCGSGHFLVEAFSMLWQMRVEEEGLGPVDAQDEVLRHNLFGLELDARCVQITMFAVALHAWKAGGGWRQLPVPNIGCSGIPVKAPLEEWKALAKGAPFLENALVRLHLLFRYAESLGSLIDPKRTTELTDGAGLQRSLEDVGWDEIVPLLGDFGSTETADPAVAVLGEDASSLSVVADLLSRRYTLVATNVPWLKRGSQQSQLAAFVDRHHQIARPDLATAFVHRWLADPSRVLSAAFVSPQSWLTAGSYESFRTWMLASCDWKLACRLGAGAFETISGEAVKPLLLVLAAGAGDPPFFALDATAGTTPHQKAEFARSGPLLACDQVAEARNPDSRVTFVDGFTGHSIGLLSRIAEGLVGMQTSDDSRYKFWFWEVQNWETQWERLQDVPESNSGWSGCTGIIRWEAGRGPLSSISVAWKGRKAWGRQGVIVSRFGSFNASPYGGFKFHQNAAVILPVTGDLIAPVLAYCRSPEFEADVRRIDQNMKVTNATLVKVPFDVDRWRDIAEAQGPLPEPWSDDPTQWLFAGRPEVSTAPLQVAVARLVGYRWPEQAAPDDLDALADADGIACLPSVAGEPPAADRVSQVLASAFGAAWSPAEMRDLLEQSSSKKRNLADWLRDEFFKQHCALFGNRPFVWHIWDGQRDGFSALVNYHRFDRKRLEKLTYTYLGQDWVERQRAEVHYEVAGADARLSAALGLQRKLEAILEGEAPFDIYVRWKQKHEQPIGWEPDLNDGVRLNVRPFVAAGVLRAPFNIHWRKDRGKNPDGSERKNDKHLTLSEKISERKQAGQA